MCNWIVKLVNEEKSGERGLRQGGDVTLSFRRKSDGPRGSSCFALVPKFRYLEKFAYSSPFKSVPTPIFSYRYTGIQL